MVIVNILVNTRKIQHPTSQRENINQNLLTIIQERVGQIAQPVQTTLLHQVIYFSNFSREFLNPNNLNSNCSNFLDMRNLQEQVKKKDSVTKNCSDLSLFE